jgi:hypothetical protein
VQSLQNGEPNGRRKHHRDPKGLGAEAPRSGVRDVPLILPFQAPANAVRNTIEELCSIATQYAANNEGAQLHPATCNSREALSDVTFQDTREGPNCGRKRHKQCLVGRNRGRR